MSTQINPIAAETAPKKIGDAQKLFAKAGKIKINIRRMLQKDLVEIARIEKSIYFPVRYWKYDDLFYAINTPGMGCLVATSRFDDNEILGYVIFRTARASTAPAIGDSRRKLDAEICNITVVKNRQRQGVGLNMLAEIVRNCRAVNCVVGEYSVKTQMFFRACGFDCVKILKKQYSYETAEGETKVFDGYRFEIQG